MFNYDRLQALKGLLKRAQFVPMDPQAAGGMPPGDPGAAGGPPPGGMPPGDPAAMGGDPSMMGGDPAAMGGMPPPGGMPPGMDPSMMAGDPAAMGMPPGMDPAAMGLPPPDAGDVSPTGEPYMKITPTQLSKLFKQFAEVFKSVLGIQSPAAGQTIAQAPAVAPQQDTQMAEVNAKLDALLRG